MKLTERSYNSKIYRPKPLVHMESDGSLLIVITSWGQPEHGQKVLDETINYISAARGDVEVTSPFEFMTCLSDQANYLRTSLLISNDLLYRAENKNEYQSGLEIVILLKDKRQLTWAQIGCPHVLVKRKNKPLMPFAINYDLPFELNRLNNVLAPLPKNLLGVDRTCQIACGDIQLDELDQVLLMASSELPPALWNNAENLDLDKITKSMMSENAELPFWAGLIQVND